MTGQVGCDFAYLMALEAGGGAAVAGRTETDPELAFLMLRLTEDLVLPVTTAPGEEEPTSDSFVLEHVGDVLLSALRDWTRDSPATASIGLARSLIRSPRTSWPTRTAAATSPPPWNGCETSTPAGTVPRH